MVVATLGGLQFFSGAESVAGNTLTQSGRGSVTFGQKPFLNAHANAAPSTSFDGRGLSRNRYQAHAVSAQTLDLETRPQTKGQRFQVPDFLPVVDASGFHGGSLPPALYRLLDPSANVDLPPAQRVSARGLDNRELDKLVAALGRSKATWRRALLLHEWLLSMGHAPDDRLCTTLIRVCAQHGQALHALSIYDWMRAHVAEGGAGLRPTVFTYTAAMRAALASNLIDRALKVWDDAIAAGCEPDCRMCTSLLEVCTRKGDTTRALAMYDQMRDAPAGSRLAPSVHAYTAAMRAAADGGAWEKALCIWSDMVAAGCQPTGHAYAAAISACAAGSQWPRAVELFDEMLELGIKPDVVSCTALISALGADAQWERAERVVSWMLQAGVRPNVRTYTALITALGNAKQWKRALHTLQRLKTDMSASRVEPNAYTYSALLKTMGEHGQWALAEQVFSELEAEAYAAHGAAVLPPREVFMMDGIPSGTASTAHPEDDEDTASALPQHPWYPPSVMGQQQSDFAADLSHMDFSRAWAPIVTPARRSLDTLAATNRRVAREAATASECGSEVDPCEDVAEALSRELHAQLNTGELHGAGSYGDMPIALAEQVLSSGEASSASDMLPDDIPGQSNMPEAPGSGFGSDSASEEPFSLFSSATQMPTHRTTSNSMQVPGVKSNVVPALVRPQMASSVVSGAKWGLEMRGNEHRSKLPGRPVRPRPLTAAKTPLNEVVCGAMMLAYERAGKWNEALGVLERARVLGIVPNTIMYNTAMSALAKSGRAEAAEELFAEIPEPDAVSYETLIAAYGMAGLPDKAEAVYQAMIQVGHTPRDYAYCGLIAAFSMKGDCKGALRVRQLMQRRRVPLTVHVYNALIAACERAQQWEKGVELHRAMLREGVEANQVTKQLLVSVGKGGSAAIADQQVAAAALSAAVAAAGSLIIRAGVF